MEKAAAPQPTVETPADCEAAIERYLAEMRRIQEQIDRDHSEITRLRNETRAILAEIKAG
jgi:hypothetical protein